MILKAQVIGIESATVYTDGERRVEIRVEGADRMFNRLRIPEKLLGMALGVDDELEVEIRPVYGLAQADGTLGTAELREIFDTPIAWPTDAKRSHKS